MFVITLNKFTKNSMKSRKESSNVDRFLHEFANTPRGGLDGKNNNS